MINMNPKFAVVVLVFVLGLVYFESCEGAPRPTNSEQLEKSIAEYLRHDPQLVKDLQELGFAEGSNSERVKRQSEFDDGSNDPELDEGQKQPGFFDRAAKFVVELLQRFLKWVNTDGN